MERNFSIKEYFDTIGRQKWYFIYPLITVISVSSIITLMLPKIYKSEANILVETRGLNPIKGIFKPRSIDIQRSRVILKILKSRAKVEELIRELGLEQNISGPEAYERLVKDIQDGIHLDTNTNTNIITISFTGEDPQAAMMIANTITGYFINQESNLLFKNKDTSAIPVLQELVIYYERRVNAARAVMTKFEMEHKGQILEYNKDKVLNFQEEFNEIETIQFNLAEAEVTIREEVEKKRILEERLAGNDEQLPDFDFVRKELTTDEKELNALYGKRDSLMAKYTSRHPEIIRVSNKIETLRRKILVSYQKEGVDAYAEEAVNMQPFSITPKYLKLRKILDKTNEHLETLQKEKEKLINRIQQLNELARVTPRDQQEYSALKRDFKVNQKIFDNLLGKVERARLLKEINAMQKSDQFAVINPAQLPLHPFSPKISKNIILGTIIGILIGTAFAMWAEISDNSLRDLTDAKDFLSIPILSTIPTVRTDEEIIRKRRINMLLTVSGTFYSLFFLMLITREFILLYAPKLLYLQTYKEWFYQLSTLLNL